MVPSSFLGLGRYRRVVGPGMRKDQRERLVTAAYELELVGPS